MELVETVLTNNPCFKAGKKIAVKGLMLHSVGCPQPSAEVFVRKWNSPDAARACVHAFIDGSTGKVYQTLPWDHRAWHGGGKSNDTHIGVEMCEPACIKYTGGASFTCSDRDAAMAVVKRTYDAAVELFAFLCGKFGLDPLADGVIVSHKEGHERGIATGHGDPDHLWNGLQSGYTMDGFRRDVSTAMGNGAAQGESIGDAAARGKAAGDAAAKAESAVEVIQEGSVVSLTPDAVYYTGKEMPGWVKSDRWIVKSVNGDRAVIDWNISRSKAICSPVSVKYLRAVSGARATVPTQTAAPGQVNAAARTAAPGQSTGSAGRETQNGGTAAGELSVSDRGVELVAKYEGCRLEAYKCPAGVWTIGYGHTAGVNPGDKLPSKEAAKELLKKDLAKYGGYVNACVKKGLLTFPLTQNQFDALTSFCYNCGNGSLQKLVEGRNAETVAEKLLQYNKGGGKVLPGLVRRREEERVLFLS